MTAPIDIECPTCKAGAGRWCTVVAPTSTTDTHYTARTLDYHHAARVDAAAKFWEQHRPNYAALNELMQAAEPALPVDESAPTYDALRAGLRDAVDMLDVLDSRFFCLTPFLRSQVARIRKLLKP